MALSAVDVALWDLKAKLLESALVVAARRRPRRRCRSTAAAGSPPTSTPARRRSSAGWVAAGHRAGEDEGRPRPRRDLARVASPPARRSATRRALRRRQRRATPASRRSRFAERFADARGDLVRGAGQLGRSRGAPARSATARPAGMDIAAGEYGYDAGRLPRMLAPARSTASRPTPRAAAGSPASSASAALADAHELDLSAHCAPDVHAHALCAVPELRAPRVVPRPRADRAAALRRLPRARGRRRSGPTARGRASGLELRHRTRSTPMRFADVMAPSGSRRRAIEASTADASTGAPLRASDRGRGPVRRRRPRALRDRRLELPAGADRRRRSRGTSTTWSRPSRLPRARRADRLARRRHQPRRPVLQRRGRHRLLEVPQPDPRDRPRAEARARRSRASSSTSSASEAERHGLTFGPDPSTHDHCTLGGMIGNNSCGVHSLMAQFYGPGPRRRDNVDELEVLTYDGERPARSAAGGAGVPGRARRTGCVRSPTATPTAIREPLPEDPAPRLGLQPRRAAARERASTSPARSSGTEGDLRHDPGGDASHLIPKPAVPLAPGAGLPRRSATGRPRDDGREHRPTRPRGDRRRR